MPEFIRKLYAEILWSSGFCAEGLAFCPFGMCPQSVRLKGFENFPMKPASKIAG
jgi:hypothetical protein